MINKNKFFIKEHTGIFKAANNYDYYNPETDEMVMECREENLGPFSKIFRFTKFKPMTPFDIVIKDMSGRQLIRLKRGVNFFLSMVEVFDENNVKIGGFKQKLFSIGGKFEILDENENQIALLAGKWTGWDFKIKDLNENELAHVSKKFAGIAKELFTTADNYMLEINPVVEANSKIRKLIVAAAVCIDMVLKEYNG